MKNVERAFGYVKSPMSAGQGEYNKNIEFESNKEYKPYTSFAWPVLPVRIKGDQPDRGYTAALIHLTLWIVAAAFGWGAYARINEYPYYAMRAPARLLIGALVSTLLTILFTVLAFLGSISFIGNNMEQLSKSAWTVFLAVLAMACATLAQILSTAVLVQGTVLWALNEVKSIRIDQNAWQPVELSERHEMMDDGIFYGTLAYAFHMMAFVRLIRNINSYPYINLVHNLNLMNPTAQSEKYYKHLNELKDMKDRRQLE